MSGQAYISNRLMGVSNTNNKTDSNKEGHHRGMHIIRIHATPIILTTVRMVVVVAAVVVVGAIALRIRRIIWVSQVKGEESVILITRIRIRLRGLMMICGRAGSHRRLEGEHGYLAPILLSRTTLLSSLFFFFGVELYRNPSTRHSRDRPTTSRGHRQAGHPPAMAEKDPVHRRNIQGQLLPNQ